MNQKQIISILLSLLLIANILLAAFRVYSFAIFWVILAVLAIISFVFLKLIKKYKKE